MYSHMEMVERHLGIKTSVFAQRSAIILPIAAVIFISSEICTVNRNKPTDFALLPKQYRMYKWMITLQLFDTSCMLFST